jgi:AraC-like DNA-binding protein
VEWAIEMMYERLGEPLDLAAMAEAATLSRYHFCRTFRRLTGVSPVRFLTAVRLNEAKRLLLTTSLSVTEICLRVGYASPGTFTSRFTLSVGVSPRRFRQLARQPLFDLAPPRQPQCRTATVPVVGSVRVEGATAAGPVLVGLFDGPIFEGRPSSCILIPRPGPWRLHAARRGTYFALALALPSDWDPLALLLPWDCSLPTGRAGPILVERRAGLHVDVVLHPPRLTDPPALLIPSILLNCPNSRNGHKRAR